MPADIVRALLAGEQVTDLRPSAGGGIPGGAGPFWLSPTDEQVPLKAAYRRARELSLPEDAAPAGRIRIDGWAEVVGRGRARLDPERVAALSSKTVLDLDAVAGTLGGGEVDVTALRVHRLVQPISVPENLSGLPPDPAAQPSEPALSDVAFEARLKGLADALPSDLTRP